VAVDIALRGMALSVCNAALDLVLLLFIWNVALMSDLPEDFQANAMWSFDAIAKRLTSSASHCRRF